MKLLVVSAVIYLVSGNRIGYAADFSDDDVGEWFNDSEENVVSGSGDIIEESSSMNISSGVVNNVSHDEKNKDSMEHINIDEEDENNDGNSQMKMRALPDAKASKSSQETIEAILLAVPLGAWLILALFMIIVLVLTIILCCLLSIRWKMKRVVKEVNTKKEMAVVKERLTKIENQGNTSFQRSATLPITASLKRISQRKGTGNDVVMKTNRAAKNNGGAVSTVVTAEIATNAEHHLTDEAVKGVAANQVLDDHDNSTEEVEDEVIINGPPEGPHFDDTNEDSINEIA